MAEITKLGLIKREPGTPVEAVVKAARQLLKEAKEGKVRGVSIITVKFGGEDGRLATESEWITGGNDTVYYVLRTSLTNMFVRAAMMQIDLDHPPEIGPELTEEDE